MATSVPQDFLEGLGAITVNFGALENSLSNVILYLVAGMSVEGQEKYQILTAQLSFKQLVWSFGSLYRQRFPGEDEKKLKDLISRCFKAEHKRNELIHSLWVGDPQDAATRLKLTARGEFKFNMTHHKKEELTEVANTLAVLSYDVVRVVITKLFPDEPAEPRGRDA